MYDHLVVIYHQCKSKTQDKALNDYDHISFLYNLEVVLMVRFGEWTAFTDALIVLC